MEKAVSAMKVESIYHPRVVTVQADERLATAAARMQDSQVRSLVVVDGNRFVGIVTEHDLARAVADGVEAGLSTVGEYMTERPATVTLDTDVREAVRTMLELECRHLPVVHAGGVVGMVSLHDLASSVLRAASADPDAAGVVAASMPVLVRDGRAGARPVSGRTASRH
jgi:CBS domain-containing protein